MKRLMLLICLLSMFLFVSLAQAQTPNMMGLYFYEEFEDICFALEGSFVAPDPALPYLVLSMNPFEYLNCSVAPGPGNGCVATIGSCMVSSEHHEIGSLKALYR